MGDLATVSPTHGLRRTLEPPKGDINGFLRPGMGKILPGAIMGRRAGSRLIEPVLDAAPRSDLEILGCYDGIDAIPAFTDAGPDGEALDADGLPVQVILRDGPLGKFDTGTLTNEITIDHIGQPCFAKNDNTLWLTDDGGTLSFAGKVSGIAANGKIEFATDWRIRSDWKTFLASGSVTAADVPIEDAGGYTTETDVEGALQELYPLVLAGMTASKKTLTANATTITAAAASEALNIDTALPANARIVGVDIHTLTPFSGGTVADFTVDVGTAGDADALIDGADLFAAAVDGGPATIPQGIRPNKFFAAGGQLIATFRCGSDDVGDAAAGAVTIDVLYVVLA